MLCFLYTSYLELYVQSVCVTEEQLMDFDRPLGNRTILSLGDEK